MPKFPTTRASLISELRNPDNAQAWTDFVELYEPVLYRLARSKGLQHADAEDLTQEVLVKTAEKASSWNPAKDQGSFRSWLGVVLRNLIIQRFGRKSAIARATEARGGDLQNLGDVPDDRQLLTNMFDHEAQMEVFRVAGRRIRTEFSAATWQAFWNTWIEGMSIAKTAETLGMSSGAVYIARSRVMCRLREEASRLIGEDS